MTTDTVQQNERAIAGLSEGELQELYSWLEQNRPQPIDARIGADFAAGRLDDAMLGALEEGRKGLAQPL